MLHQMEYVPMRDGVKLFTNIWLPSQTGRYPVIIVRNPYESPQNYANEPKDEGYVKVMQSCRGTAASQGELEAYINERSDGLDLLEWVRRQPFYNGEIYITGSSYLCTSHLMYLDTCPPDIKGGVLNVQDGDRYNIHYENGQYKAGLHLGWSVENYRRRHPELNGRYDLEKACFEQPFNKFSSKILGKDSYPTLDEAFAAPDPNDEYWTKRDGIRDGRHALDNVDFPVLLTTAHYDLYIHGIPKMWAKMKPETRKKSMFIIAPYNHGWCWPGSYKFANDRVEILQNDLEKKWFEYSKTGKFEGFGDFELGKTNYYVLFGDRWCSEEFLTDGANEKKLYFSSGRLVGDIRGGSVSYKYDPDHPTTFNGCCGNVFGEMAAQHGIGTKPDIVSFITEPSKEKITVKGVQKITLCVKSDCEDTAFYVRLSIIKADGTAYGIRDRITSISHELGKYEPGSEVELNFELDPVAFELKAGESLRIDVASAFWNCFMPHPNVAGLWSAVVGKKTATNTVMFGKSFCTLKFE